MRPVPTIELDDPKDESKPDIVGDVTVELEEVSHQEMNEEVKAQGTAGTESDIEES